MVGEPGSMERVQRSFGFQWKAHYQDRFEKETVFGRTAEQDIAYFMHAMGVTPADIEGRTILDAGCGCGRLTRMLAEMGAEAVCGIDISDAAAVAHDECAHMPNVHIAQADIFRLPFAPDTFDYVWSNGVIHHTPDAKHALACLSACVRPGGSMYVWVYSTDFNPFRFAASVCKSVGIRPRLQGRPLVALCKALAPPSLVALKAYQVAHALRTRNGETVKKASKARARSLEEIAFTWHDSLSPEFDSRHSRDEVIGWFSQNGFSEMRAMDFDVPFDSPELAKAMFGAASGVGVRGRKTLNPIAHR